MTKYLKLWFIPESGKRSKTMLLEVLKETPVFYIGRKVDRYGEDDSYMDSEGTVIERIQMIQKSAVAKTKDMKMNLKYGELVGV